MGSTVQVCTISILLLCTKIMTNYNYLAADIPECERGLDDCDQNATCTNTIGDYICTCNIGFTGDGYMCLGQLQQFLFDYTALHFRHFNMTLIVYYLTTSANAHIGLHFRY